MKIKVNNKEWTPGVVRYFTYFLIFPGDNDVWVDQTPFVHDLHFELSRTRWAKDKNKMNDLLKKGETQWKDHNGVTHRVVIETIERPRRWGNRKPGT